jgi:hypothetical protein
MPTFKELFFAHKNLDQLLIPENKLTGIKKGTNINWITYLIKSTTQSKLAFKTTKFALKYI